MADNTRYMARVPIIPDDFENKDRHKENELVMDYNTNDIYAKKNDGYISITGKIKEEIKQIQDGSMVVHLVTEDSLPPIKDRPTNHWYFVITDAVDASKGKTITQTSYIYYGLVDSYSRDKNYILVAQNMIEGTDTVKIVVKEGYTPCFYVPISYGANFKNADTGEDIEYSVQDRVYTLNNELGSFIAYDVYLLNVTEEGEYFITIDVTGSDYFTISFDSNITVAGLVLPEEIHVYDGDAIGDLLPIEPEKTDARYDFKGWSTSKLAANIIDSTYKPESAMTLYAWYEYNEDPTVITYYSTYVSTTGLVIGSYCSTAKMDQIITPRVIAGYTAPEGQTLKEDGQQFTFTYTPITYNIEYVMNGGSFSDSDTVKRSFIVEDDTYIPPTPAREDYQFAGWTPISLAKGTTEDVTFTAKWEANAILLTGSKFNTLINQYFGKENITTLATASSLIDDGTVYYNVSSTETPIYVWYKDGVLWFHCKYDIYTPLDMSGAFEGFSLLRDISILSTWKTKSNMTVTNIFKNCSLLSDVSGVSNWANGNFNDFTGAFDGTVAASTGRVPDWYRWEVTIAYKVYNESYEIDETIETETRSCIPGQTVYAKDITGYKDPNPSSITISSPNTTYTFTYDIVIYKITYDLNGGKYISGAEYATGYNVIFLRDTVSYTPPAVEKDGATFAGWSPEKLEYGTTGAFTFTALWE